MRYIDLINNFWVLNEEQVFTANETKLYFALLNMCNKLRWKNPFNQSNMYLAYVCGLSEPSIIRARNTLKQRGLIDFKSFVGRRKNSEYTIKYLNNFSNSGSISDSFSVSNCGEKSLDNIRHIDKRREYSRKSNKKKSNAVDDSYTIEQKAEFEKFNKWIDDEVSYIRGVRDQLAIVEYFKLREQYDKRKIIEIITKMSNWKKITKNNVSVYRTFLDWAKREYNNQQDARKDENKNVVDI